MNGRLPMKIRLAIWALFVSEIIAWSLVAGTHQKFVWLFPGMLVAYSALLAFSLVVIEISIVILPRMKKPILGKLRTVISGLIFLAFTVLITNPFDWIPQSHHIMRAPYWDVFALNLAGVSFFWLLTSRFPKRVKPRQHSNS